MPFGICVEVWGDYALFTRPEMKVERVSYDVITPSAARGILDAICWKPEIKWVIDKIYVCKPIKFVNIRRNEVGSKISARNVQSVINGKNDPLGIIATKDRQQRASMILKDVRYVIEAHFKLQKDFGSDAEKKYYNIILRRLEKGQNYHTPYFGCREFPANVALYKGGPIQTAYTGTKDLGYMLYDMDYSDPNDIKPKFFRAIMMDGVIDLTECEVVQ
ncbi:MAG: type I-C CRISPR-associated protein Cas5c [Clostridia bacterium]